MNSHSTIARAALAPLFSALLALAPAAVSAQDQEPVSPVSSSPTGNAIPGKVSWYDLVTDNMREAGAFYQRVFGWRVAYSRDNSLAHISQGAEPLATISHFEKKTPKDEAVWLISLSVADVDAAAARVTEAGGQVLEGPEDLPRRGRYALIRDPRGAMLMLLEPDGGDGADGEVQNHQFLWAELWTDDPEAASAFYEEVVGYRSVAVKDGSGDEILVMGRDTQPRASVVQIPWEDLKPNWLPYIAVDDLVSITRTAVLHGGEVVIAPMEDSDGSRVAVLADPTGGVFAIQQRAEP